MRCAFNAYFLAVLHQLDRTSSALGLDLITERCCIRLDDRVLDVGSRALH